MKRCLTSLVIKEMQLRTTMRGDWTSLVVQWLRICLSMQETRVQSLVWEIRSHVPQIKNQHTTTKTHHRSPKKHNEISPYTYYNSYHQKDKRDN